MHPHGRESGKIGARMLQRCCILRCLGPEGANLVNNSRTLPCCRIFVHIPSEMAVLTEAHQQMSDLTHASAWARIWQDRRARMLQGCCILRCLGPERANLVNKNRTLPCCRIFAHIPSEMAVLTEAHQQMSDLTHASAWARIWQDRR